VAEVDANENAEVDATVNAVADDDATAGQQLRGKNRLLKF